MADIRVGDCDELSYGSERHRRGDPWPADRSQHVGVCAVRCPMEVTVEDGRVTWLQGNTHDPVLGAQPVREGRGRAISGV